MVCQLKSGLLHVHSIRSLIRLEMFPAPVTLVCCCALLSSAANTCIHVVKHASEHDQINLVTNDGHYRFEKLYGRPCCNHLEDFGTFSSCIYRDDCHLQFCNKLRNNMGNCDKNYNFKQVDLVVLKRNFLLIRGYY